jgi:thioredoxin 2
MLACASMGAPAKGSWGSLAREHAGKLKVVKVNTDQNPRLAAQYRVMSIPTLMLFQRGNPVATWVGFQPKRVLEERLKPYLG